MGFYQTAIVPILERVYDLPTPDDERTVPMEVLALGLSRSGTDSLKQALEILGHGPCYHGFVAGDNLPHMKTWTTAGRSKFEHDGHSPVLDREFFDTVLGSYRAVTDLPAVNFAPELIAAYPEAKIILNHRDVDSWYLSCQQVIQPLENLPIFLYILNKTLFWHSQGFGALGWKYLMRPGFAQYGRTAYRDHCLMVKGAARPGNLLVWKIGDGWEPLCEFLGKPVPDVPFPNGNTKSDIEDRFNLDYTALIETKKKRQRLIKAAIVLAEVGVVAALAGGAKWYGLFRNWKIAGWSK